MIEFSNLFLWPGCLLASVSSIVPTSAADEAGHPTASRFALHNLLALLAHGGQGVVGAALGAGAAAILGGRAMCRPARRLTPPATTRQLFQNPSTCHKRNFSSVFEDVWVGVPKTVVKERYFSSLFRNDNDIAINIYKKSVVNFWTEFLTVCSPRLSLLQSSFRATGSWTVDSAAAERRILRCSCPQPQSTPDWPGPGLTWPPAVK